jgi:hypothetical protein
MSKWLKFVDLPLESEFYFRVEEPAVLRDPWTKVSPGTAERGEEVARPAHDAEVCFADAPPQLTFGDLDVGTRFQFKGENVFWTKLTEGTAVRDVAAGSVPIPPSRQVGFFWDSGGDLPRPASCGSGRQPTKTYIDGRREMRAEIRGFMVERATTLFMACNDTEAQAIRDLLQLMNETLDE